MAAVPIGQQPATGSVSMVPAVPPAAVTYDRKSITTTGTAVALPAHALLVGVVVQALAGNSGPVYVGDSAVTTSTGFQLGAGQSLSIAVANTNALYVVGTSRDSVCLIGN